MCRVFPSATRSRARPATTIVFGVVLRPPPNAVETRNAMPMQSGSSFALAKVEVEGGRAI